MNPNDNQPSHRTDQAYWDAVLRYLVFLAAACLIAAVFAGPVMFLVWIAAAVVLLGSNYASSNRPPSTPQCHSKGRRGY